MVGVAAAGHRDVGDLAGHAGSQQRERGVDGHPLGAVRGGRVAELDTGGDVAGVEGDDRFDARWSARSRLRRTVSDPSSPRWVTVHRSPLRTHVPALVRTARLFARVTTMSPTPAVVPSCSVDAAGFDFAGGDSVALAPGR